MDFITIEAQSERATIVPEAGCQCFEYRVGSLDVVAGPATLDVWREHPFRSGIPLLFPWPGRVANGVFHFGGREIRLPLNEPAHGHAIHGLSWNCAFQVTRRGPYYIHTALDASSNAELQRLWPYPFLLQIDYEVGNGLRVRAEVRNTGSEPMPFGLGAHPYFHAPIGGAGKREDLLLQVPGALSQWPLDDRMIPTGPPVALAGKCDLRTPRKLGTESYDDAFHLDPARNPADPCGRLVNAAAKIAIEVRAEADFGEFVTYAPPDRTVVAMEPYTCAPDAFNLAARGIASGVRVLKPGESFETGFEIRLSAP
ncbi:MAG: aldose 1-epimerase [Candidatus Binataceae bacterium]